MIRTAIAWSALACLPVLAAPAPIAHGVVFFCPPKPEAAVAELEKIQADGYNLVTFASWCWTLPRPGSDLERTAGAVLEWCDAHDMRFFLMHNIQFGAQEGASLDDAVEDPMRAAKFLTDWVRVLKGHRSVAGIILGNEVGPTAGKPGKHPTWWAGFRADLKARHATVDALNAAWGTDLAGFEAVEAPPERGTPARADYSRYAVSVFDRYYGTLFRRVCEPELGRLLYGAKTGGDPLLHRACESLSMICWDDGVADYPQWRVKALGDVARATGKPVFNAELHLYHEFYAYGGSAAKSRYRYLLSALNGEWMSASFAWGQWSKPGAQALHRATPAILSDLRKLEPHLRAFPSAMPEVHVVLSGPTAGDDVAAQRLYTAVAGLGCPWEYTCPQDIPRIGSGTVYIPEQARLPLEACRALAALPEKAKIVLAAPDALRDEHGRPLPDTLAREITLRANASYGVEIITRHPDERLHKPYIDSTEAFYLSWSEKRGHFKYPLVYPGLEARKARIDDGWLVAVINHATEGAPLKAKLPWLQDTSYNVMDLTAQGAHITPDTEQTFAPLDIRVYRYSRK
jgi:hypothetical protein